MKSPLTDRIVFSLVILTILLKSVVWLNSGRFHDMFSDEERNYQIAWNNQNGLGYTIDGELTAFHASTPVFIYEFLISNDISKTSYVIFGHILNILVFGFSIFYFNRILMHFAVPRWIRYTMIILYIIYPSNLEFIGNKFNYERLAMPLLVISFFYLLELKATAMDFRKCATVAVLMSVVTLFRPQFIYIMPFIIGAFGLIAFIQKQRGWRRFAVCLALMLLCTFLLHIPELKKNHSMFGSYILSTQGGYEFMQGHCDIAKGSWNGSWADSASEYATYSRQMIPGIDQMNELEQSDARMSFAKNWILNHPVEEFVLIIRKVAIFFIPRNFLGNLNIINGFVHLSFIISLFIMGYLYTRKDGLDWEILTILSPIMAALSLSLIFFVGYRWRYYAEPFMIIWISVCLSKIISLKSVHN